MWRLVEIVELSTISNVMLVIEETVIMCITIMEIRLHLLMAMRSGMHNLLVTIHAALPMKQNRIVDFMMVICIFRIGGEIIQAIV